MKKLLLTVSAALLSAVTIQAQTRMSLYEEFSGENCGPCATYNPGLTTLLNANTSKIIQIKYQSPIPSAGPIYNAYKTVTNARIAYYNVPFAPYGVQNGNEVTGNIASYTQSNINASVANAAPFSITVTHQWNAAGDSITANVSITSPNAYAPAATNLKLRVALIEHLSYCTAPGTNGETEFHNVVREMYPDATGTSLPNTWTMGQTQTISLKGKVAAYVDKSNSEALVVAWIQNDSNKAVLQAAKSTRMYLPVDAALTGCAVPQLACATGAVNVAASVTLTNTGSTPLTAATITYNLDNGTSSTYNWTGTLGAGGSTIVTLPAQSITVGAHLVSASVSLPNGSTDVNAANNANTVRVTVRDATPAALPISEDFESGILPSTWTLYDVNGNGAGWVNKSTSGHNASARALQHMNYSYPTGETNYAILPNGTLPAGSKALDFYVAYAQYTTENDKLEVVYSTNCGVSWSTVWSAAGAALATHAPVGNNVSYTPTEDDWRLKSIDMSAVPQNATIALRAVSDFGNNLYVDDINLHAGTPTGVGNVITNSAVSLYPNPASGSASLDFTLAKSGKVVVSVLDATGRTVSIAANATLQQGAQHIAIPTTTLAAGVYNVAIRTEEGTLTQRLSVVK